MNTGTSTTKNPKRGDRCGYAQAKRVLFEIADIQTRSATANLKSTDGLGQPRNVCRGTSLKRVDKK